MLTALSAIVSAQAEPTEETMAHCKHFLNYASTHQAVILTYTRTNMVLVVHSDASYLPLRYGRPDQQWGCSQPCATHQGWYVLHSRSRTGHTLHQHTWSHPTMQNTSRNGPQTAPDSHENQQQHSPRSRKQQHTSPTHKSHGHEIPLA